MAMNIDIHDLRTQLLLGLGCFTAYLGIEFLLKLKAVGISRTKFFPFQPFGLPGALLPNTWWNAGALYAWQGRNTIYKPWETFAVVPFLSGQTLIFTSSMEVTRQVTAHKAPFDKDKPSVQGLRLFGENLVTEASYGDWSRHRRVVNPAFNQELYRRVWESSVRTFKDMTASEGWDMKDVVDVPNIGELVGKFALLIITDVGFGMPLPWDQPPGSTEEGMTLLEAFETMTRNLLLNLITPKWAMGLPIKELQRTKQSHDKIFSVMREFVNDRRTQLASRTDDEKTSESRTIFNLLLDANDSESKGILNEQELFSNVFVMLFAGHETSAKTMGATLGLLAVHPEEQERAYICAKQLLGSRDPTFEDFDALRPIQACLMEALRLFPTGSLIIRRPTEDTVLRPEGEEPPMIVSPKHLIICDVTGICYNPRYYPDPNAFKPSRWTDPALEPEYLTFGAGPRACIGRKFAMYEMTCFLALFLRDWKVEAVLRQGESPDGWKKRVLDDTVTLSITMGPDVVPVRIVRRP